MKQNFDNGKFILQNELRTWSQLKRQKAEQNKSMEIVTDLQRRNTLSHFLKDGRDSIKRQARRDEKRLNSQEHLDHVQASHQSEKTLAATSTLSPIVSNEQQNSHDDDDDKDARASRSPLRSNVDSDSQDPKSSPTVINRHAFEQLKIGMADAATPHDAPARKEYFNDTGDPSDAVRKSQEKPTTADLRRWATESGFGRGKQADALGDDPGSEVEDDTTELLDEIEKAEEYDRSFRGSVY